MVDAAKLREMVDEHSEWLLVRERGRTFPMDRGEIEIDGSETGTRLSFLEENGYRTWRLRAFEKLDDEISLDVTAAFERSSETMRLVPRASARGLIAEAERARLEKANAIASLIKQSCPGVRLRRVGLNVENGRLAQIQFDDAHKGPSAALSDITAGLTPEEILASALPWLGRLMDRKRPIRRLLIVAEQNQARAVQKLHTLLNEFWRSRIVVVRIDRRSEPAELIELAPKNIRDLWREKARKIDLPRTLEPGIAASRLTELAPQAIDRVVARNGETLRFNGLPFARVRRIGGVDRTWFGVGRQTTVLSTETENELYTLIGQLTTCRSPKAANKRHRLYRAASETWLESLLRRKIDQLDANLILSPLYNQFRSSSDKIDLLALRRDGRLIIIELKTQPDRGAVLQVADYWRKIELQRRRGVIAAANLFEGREVLDRPALIYLVAPAWSFHRDVEFFARSLSPEIELWRFELHEDWRREIKVIARIDHSAGGMNL